jgi:DNA-binding transcriptional MerR regulator
VKVSELSRRSGVSLPTIKYYLREGVLQAGVAMGSNQADYDDGHVRRLRLVRALIEVGGLSIAQVLLTLAAVDDTAMTIHDAFGVAQDGVSPASRGAAAKPDADQVAALREVARWLRVRRWKVRPDAMARLELADTLVAMDHVGWGGSATAFDALADHVFAVAATEIELLDQDGDRSHLMEQSIMGTVLFEQAYCSIRRLALEHHSRLRFGRRH